MRGKDLIAAIAGKPTPFDLNGVGVYLRPLTMPDLLAYKAVRDEGKEGEAALMLVSLSVCDEAGEQVLSPELAGQLPVAAVEKLAQRIAAINGFSGDDGGKAP